MEPGAGSTIGIVAERGSVDEGVVLAARTIGALCMRAESIMHLFSFDCSKDRPTCLLRHPDDLAVASRRAGTSEYVFATAKNCDAAGDCATDLCGMVCRNWRRGGLGRDMKVL